MSETENTKRLSKVAKELNVGISTILDYLNTKGFTVENNPNAKISGDIYKVLLGEFQTEKNVKEESKLIGLNKTKKENVVHDEPQTAKPSRHKDPESEILIKNVGSSVQDEPVSKPAPAKPVPVPAEEPKPVAETPAPAKQDDDVKVNVVGKIDLSSMNTKTRPDKKASASKKEKAEAKPEPVAEEPVKPVNPEPVAEVPKEEPVKAEEEPAKKPETELYKTKTEKLEGPTILGKMVLPEKQKKPVASSSTFVGGDKNKKKRKRIRKEGEKPAPNTGERKQYNRPADGRKPAEKAEPTEAEIQNQIKETLARLSGSGKSKSSKYRKLKRDAINERIVEEGEAKEAGKKVIKVTEFVSANELATMMNVPVNQIISTCMSLGMFVSINQRLDATTLNIVAEEFGFTVEFVSVEVQEAIREEEDVPEDLKPRAPIVTVMGHVDHGKTSLLDYIRKANVIAGEAGGITQHIGAYEVKLENGKSITFLDTPGHEAFTAMRARGAKLTDVAIIVVAADDSVMPQTIEAINHAQAAGVPIVFAINKMDKPGANSEKIREQLSQMNILVEEWGGKYQCQEISAKKGTNIDALLDKVLLEAEILDLKANPKKAASGTIVESSLDKGRGYLTTLLVQNGTLRVGDTVLAGCFSGKVKALFNERNQNIKEAGPSGPALMLGLSGAPQAGDKFNVMLDEREARDIATKRLQLQREQGYRTTKHITLDEIGRRLAIGDFKELNVIVKGDVDGSIEALSDALQKLSSDQISVRIIHKSVGAITESDVLLASASNAIIVGFQVRPSNAARKLAENEQIDIRLYSIIYDAINEVKAAMEGMLAPTYEEKVVCNIEVRETFNITKIGTIAGCMVLDGKVTRNTKIRLIRDGIVVHSGELGSLKRFKDDVKEVSAGYECGLNINNFNDIKVGDIIEGYENVEVKRKL